MAIKKQIASLDYLVGYRHLISKVIVVRIIPRIKKTLSKCIMLCTVMKKKNCPISPRNQRKYLEK